MANPSVPAPPVAPEHSGAAAPLPLGKDGARTSVILTQPHGRRRDPRLHLGRGARPVAAHGRAPADRWASRPAAAIALLSKNTAQWLMADFAIWMAGHVSVPLYPTLAADTIRQILEHSESKLLFVGKLDGWEAMRPGVPAGAAVHRACRWRRRTSYPQWDDIVAAHRAASPGDAGARRRRARDHHVHLGHHRHAQGRDAQLRHLRLVDRRRA